LRKIAARGVRARRAGAQRPAARCCLRRGCASGVWRVMTDSRRLFRASSRSVSLACRGTNGRLIPLGSRLRNARSE